MRRYRFHLIIAAVLSAVGLTVAVSVHAQHPQYQQPYSRPGLFQQIREGLFGAPSNQGRSPTPAQMPPQRSMQQPSMQQQQMMQQQRFMQQQRAMQQRYGTPSRGGSPQGSQYPSGPSGPQGAPTVGQFFRNLIGDPLTRPGQPQPNQQMGQRPMQPMQYGQTRAPRAGIRPPAMAQRSGMRTNLGFRRPPPGSGGAPTRSALTRDTTDRSESYRGSNPDFADSRRGTTGSSRSRQSEELTPADSSSSPAVSSRRTFSSQVDDLTHPQGSVRTQVDSEVNRRIVSSPSERGTSRRGTASDSESRQPTLAQETEIVPPTKPLTNLVEKPATTPPAVEPLEPAEEPRRMVSGGANVPTMVDPIHPPTALQHTPPARSEPEVADVSMKAPALVVQTLGPRQIVVGKEATYRIALRNLGLVAANAAVVTVQIPETADVADATPTRGRVHLPGTEGATEGIRWKLASLAAGGKEELILKLVPRDPKPLQLAVSAISAPAEGQVEIEVREPKLQLGIAGPREVNYGETVVYELTFANAGTADAENVMVRLMPIDPGDEADVHRIGTVEAGSKQVVEIELVARQSGHLNIQAEATGDSGLKSEARREVTVLKPELRVEMTGPKFRYARTIATYEVRVTNPGNAVARGVQLGAMLPVQSTFISCTGGGDYEKETNKVHWQLPDLQPGGEQIFKLRCELQKPGENRIQVAALADQDLRDANFISTQVQTLADLDLDVRDPNGPMPVGEDVTYEVIITNRGSKSADNVQVFAYFSEGIEPQQVLGHRHVIQPGKVVLDPIPKLAPGEEARVKIIAKADRSGTLVFRAEVVCPSLNAKLSEQETTRFYGEGEGQDGAPEAEPPRPFTPGGTSGIPGLVEPSSANMPAKVTPSHPRRIDPNKLPDLRKPRG